MKGKVKPKKESNCLCDEEQNSVVSLGQLLCNDFISKEHTMAEFMEIHPETFDRLTSLQKALEIYDKDSFLEFKRNLLKEEFDEEKQFKIWEDYHKLMFRAANSSFRTGDWELLQSYRFSMTDMDPTLRLLNLMREAVHR